MPLFYLSVAFLMGVTIAPNIPWPASTFLAVGGSALLAAGAVYWLEARFKLAGKMAVRFPLSPGVPTAVDWVLMRLQLSSRVFTTPYLAAFPLLVAAAAMFGAARQALSRPDFENAAFIGSYNDDGQRYTVTGILAAPPDRRDAYTLIRVRAETIRPADGILHAEVFGLLLARVEPGEDWQFGDRLVITARLETPPEDEAFSYRNYLAGKGVYSLASFAEASRLETGKGNPVMAGIFSLRRLSFETLHKLYPDPAGSLLAGILLGIESGIPPDLQEAFKKTGTAHIVAISGFNITILSALFLSLFGRLLGKRAGAWAAVVGVGLYTVLVGADAAVVRASAMGILAIALRDTRRTGAIPNILAATAAGMACANPGVLRDAGFQLSFAATVGLVQFASPLSRGFAWFAVRYLRISTARRITPFVADAFLLTLAAQVTTLPVIWFHFGQISVSAFLVNPLVLPVQPAIMILGGISLAAGLVWLPAGRALAWLVLPLLAWTIRLVEWFGKLSWGVWVLGGITLGLVLVLYGIVFGLPLLLSVLRSLKLNSFAWRGGLILVLAAASAAMSRAGSQPPDGLLHITVLDVGAGDGVLLQGPTGRRVLVDGGGKIAALSSQLGRRIPPGQRSLDWLVVARTGDQQLAALPVVLERFPPQRVLWAGTPLASRSARELQESLAEWQVPATPAERGQILELGGGVELEVVGVQKSGAVLLIRWHRFRALLPIGQDLETIDREVGPVNLLLLAEGGFAPLNPPEWIRGLYPEMVVISVEAGSREGLPSPSTLEAVEPYNLLRTDRHGWIEVRTDGFDISVLVEKGG